MRMQPPYPAYPAAADLHLAADQAARLIETKVVATSAVRPNGRSGRGGVLW